VRWFTKKLKKGGRITRLSFSSFDNHMAPCLLAVTAEAPNTNANANAKTEAKGGDQNERGSPRVLIVGGGSAHDFDRWFNKKDTDTLEKAGASVRYTNDSSDIVGQLSDTDVLTLTNNNAMDGKQMRQRIFEFVNGGNGLMVLHASTWRNWDWPRYYRELIGGAANGHRSLGEFQVKVTKPDHPVMQGVSKTFKITDELYYFIPGEDAAKMNVLATATHPEKDETFPVVWTVEHPDGRIAVTSLGHDGKAHKHPAYKAILTNGAKWTAPEQ
jgi:type 1 glutamine amidotransferase